MRGSKSAVRTPGGAWTEANHRRESFRDSRANHCGSAILIRNLHAQHIKKELQQVVIKQHVSKKHLLRSRNWVSDSPLGCFAAPSSPCQLKLMCI
jgi:hypothetical protein